MCPTRARGVFLSLALAVAAVLAIGGEAAAVEPIDLRDEGTRDGLWPTPPPPPDVDPSTIPPRPAPESDPTPQSTPQPTPPPTPSPTPEPTATPIPTPEYGLDVSYPQCNDALPEAFAFAIVGVNGGKVYDPNPCLGPDDDEAGQLAWAGRDVQLYANTGNPGPRDSRFWPVGQDGPVACEAAGLFGSTDTRDCAYLYGWKAAEDSYATALAAFVNLGWADEDAEALPWPTTWWLDVEVANSWRFDRRLNVAALEGARDYLESMAVAEVGFYSTPRMWGWITGGTTAFEGHPAWHAGATDLEDARERCGTAEAFTGGELRMVQWVEDGLDHNIRCP